MIPRTWLYVPGHRVDRITKALDSRADAVVVDLEDAVPPQHKATALETALKALSGHDSRKPLWIRVNALGSPWVEREVRYLAALGDAVAGVRLPKAEDPDAVQRFASQLTCPVDLLVESARGLMQVPELALCHERIRTIMLGEADLAADLRVHGDGLEWARGWVVATTRANNLASPVQSVWTDIADLEGLRASSRAGRKHGFYGRSVIHPRQIDVVNLAFTPSEHEVEKARAIVDAAESSSQDPGQPIVLDDGRFVDPAVVAQARNTLNLAMDKFPKPTSGL